MESPVIEQVMQVFEHEAPAYEHLASVFWSEGNLPGKFNFQNFRQTWNALQAGGVTRLWRSVVDDKVTGLLGAIKFPDLMTGDLHVTEMFWYVLPEWRVGSQGMRLFLELGRWIEEIQARRLLMIRIEGLNDNRMDQFYIDHGFRKCETHYIKEFDWS